MRHSQIHAAGRRVRLATGLALIAMAFWGFVPCGQNAILAQAAEARPSLLDGVERIAAPGVPGPLCVFGPRAHPVVLGKAGHDVWLPVVAAGRLGEGRVVAFGHTGYLDAATLAIGDTGTLLANAVGWAAGQPGADRGTIRVATHGLSGIAEFLRKKGFRAAAMDGPDWLAKLKHAQVVCLRPGGLSDQEVKALWAFLRQGGGLIAADLGWGWAQLHPGKSLRTDHPGNRLLAPAGIVWADGYLERTATEGFAAGSRPAKLTHAAHALEALAGHGAAKPGLGPKELAQATAVVMLAARSIAPDDTLLRPQLDDIRRKHAAGAAPGPKQPVRVADALLPLAMTLELEAINGLPPEQTKALAGAEAFPGPVPASAKRVTRAVRIDTEVPGWHSTGLYAAPGELVRVNAPSSAMGKRLAVRVGCHADALWHADAWRRWPEICRQFPLAAEVTPAANALGGPIYVEVPDGCRAGKIEVSIAGGVEAPHYVLGETSASEWRAAVRARPAPWAELEGSRVVLSVPAQVVRGLDDPEPLMTLWDRVAEACEELSGRPPQRRKQRYVADVQISAGYMHSGYPIMTHLDVAPLIVDRQRIVGFKQDGAWGFFHEMGHNFQSPDWTFEGTGEVTCNLFTLYVFHRACDHPTAFDEKVPPKNQREMLARYQQGGRDFGQWKKDPFLALLMYVQLQRAFGWEPFQKVFAEYRDAPAAERPKNDDEKRDQWMIRLSRTVGRNLGPFFETWGVPTSAPARASIAQLPKWMPEGLGGKAE